MQHIKSVHMIILMQSDLAAAVEFYNKLGIKLKFHLKDKWAEFALGDIKIGLCPTSAQSTERHTGIVLDVDDVKKLYNELKDSISFISEPIEKVHGIMVGVKDPGGNIVDLYQPTPEKLSQMVKDVATQGCCSDTSCICGGNKKNES